MYAEKQNKNRKWVSNQIAIALSTIRLCFDINNTDKTTSVAQESKR